MDGHIVYTSNELTELLDFHTCSDTFKSKQRFEQAADEDIYEAMFCGPDVMEKIQESAEGKNKEHPYFIVKKELVAIE